LVVEPPPKGESHIQEAEWSGRLKPKHLPMASIFDGQKFVWIVEKDFQKMAWQP
jgi:hypothetical protein